MIKFISVSQYCQETGIKKSTVYKYIGNGTIPAIRVGNTVRIESSFNYPTHGMINMVGKVGFEEGGHMNPTEYLAPLTANGSITKKRGFYRLERFPLRYTGRFDDKGKPEKEYAPLGKFQTRKDAENYRFECQKLREQYRKAPKEDVSLVEYIMKYIKIEKAHCKADTINAYLSWYRRYFAPAFQNVTLNTCTGDMLKEFFAQTSKVVDTAHYVPITKGAFAKALQERLIDRDVSAGLKGSKKIDENGFPIKKERLPLSKEEDASLVSYILKYKPSYWYVLLLLRYTGARDGEILGLEWKDIDLNSCTVNINKSWGREKGRLIWKDTKNSYSKRIASFPVFLKDILSEVREVRMYEKYFAQSRKTGNPVGDNVIRKSLKNSAKAVDITDRPITPHVFRHTYITNYLVHGGGVKDLMKQVGHSDERMIMKVYAHVQSDYLDRSRNIAEQDATGYLFQEKQTEQKIITPKARNIIQFPTEIVRNRCEHLANAKRVRRLTETSDSAYLLGGDKRD